MLIDAYFAYFSFKGSHLADNQHADLRHDINVCNSYLMFIFINIVRAQSYHPIILHGFIEQLKNVLHSTSVQLDLRF